MVRSATLQLVLVPTCTVLAVASVTVYVTPPDSKVWAWAAVARQSSSAACRCFFMFSVFSSFSDGKIMNSNL